ncbi:fibronectin-binding A domain protein [Toxoplasma gondii TgCatPRC2]|uniref:Fibronectin-binding A domain protein n=2 Tax=Toxoplasma gondii TaxID=5811 RepID=A0A151HIR9_TOXGO|nr:fibronectin-binding A domain protein [Toxoplasma gondii TgCatPRC2]PIL98971.1 fibronectin-binding A domain protein [Toxoplasma gondii COUG]
MQDRHGVLILITSIVTTCIMKLHFSNAYAMRHHRPLLLRTANFLFPSAFSTRYTPAWQGTSGPSWTNLQNFVSTGVEATPHRTHFCEISPFLADHCEANKRQRHHLPRAFSILPSQLTAPIVGQHRSNQRWITTDTGVERGLLTLKIDEDDGNWTTLIIGRTAEQNERVSLVVARPTDLWFHVRDFPGAHVILRGQGCSWKPTKHHMQLAADCACYFSKGRGKSEQMAVTFTTAKNVSKVKGAPVGTVHVASPQTTMGRPSAVEELVKKIMEERVELNNKKKHRPKTTAPSSARAETPQKTTMPQKTG